MTVEEVDWRDLFDAAREGMLGDGPVGRGRIIKELRSRGYADPGGMLDQAVDDGVIRAESGVVPKYELVEGISELDIAEFGSSESRTGNTAETKTAGGRVLEAFETAVEFMCGRLDDPLPEDCDVDAETPREYFEDIRGWDSDTVEEKRLGYAPTSPTALLDALMEEGYTRDEILATGLFYEGLTPHFQGRVVLPYFDNDGKSCYAISRSVGHPNDPRKEQKYTKAVKTKECSRVDEPRAGFVPMVQVPRDIVYK